MYSLNELLTIPFSQSPVDRIRWGLIFTGLSILLNPSLLWSQTSIQPLNIDYDLYTGALDTSNVDLSPFMGYYYEKEETVNIEALIKGLENPNFQHYTPDLFPNERGDVYWVMMEVHNSMDQKAELSLSCFAHQSVLYLVQPGNILTVDTAGFNLPVSQWPAMQDVPAVFDGYTIPFEIAPNTHVSLYLRVQPHFYNEFDDRSIALYTKRSYLKYDLYSNNLYIRWQALYQGMFLVLLLFNLLIFFYSRDLTYLFYSLYVANMAYYFLVIFGYDRLWLWGSDAPFMPVGQNLSIYGIGIFYSLFCIYFLHQNDWRPKIRRWLTYLLYLTIAGAFLSSALLLTQPPMDQQTSHLMNLLFIPVGIIGSSWFLLINVLYLLSKNKPARYFAIAGLILFVGMFLSILSNILQSVNLISSLNLEWILDPPSVLILEGACVLQVLFFALALSYRAWLIEKGKFN
jgi:hypothetical protein